MINTFHTLVCILKCIMYYNIKDKIINIVKIYFLSYSKKRWYVKVARLMWNSVIKA